MNKILRRIKTFCAGGGVGARQGAPSLTPKVVAIGLFFLVCSPAFALEGKASWYSVEACTEPHKKIYTKKCLTANGESLYELERTKQDFAATWNYPMGARVKIINVRNGKTVVVRIVDRGPSKRLGRVADLSKSAFAKISSLKEGVIYVKTENVSSL